LSYWESVLSAIELIKLLADGEFHSGEELGKSLGISRAAIWKQLKQLESLELSLQSVKGLGYRLTEPIIFLDAEKISAQLMPSVLSQMADIRVVESIDSTNSELIDQSRYGLPSGTVLIAEQQLAGRGRRGRIWQSPFARNLYVSVLWHFHGGVAALEGLSLAVGAILLDALENCGIENLALKWPNDILFNEKKLGGILVEMTGDMAGSCAAVIGFGINVNMPKKVGADIDQPWIDLASITGCGLDRNDIMAKLLNNLIPGLTMFSTAGFSAFQQKWQRYDALLNREVVAVQGDNIVVGLSRGITATGGLKIETDAGEKIITGGEVSVRMRL
jgi:BirA family biotin operon repressor/biotin-[acetyl-CoA-carboxylase] ligase